MYCAYINLASRAHLAFNGQLGSERNVFISVQYDHIEHLNNARAKRELSLIEAQGVNIEHSVSTILPCARVLFCYHICLLVTANTIINYHCLIALKHFKRAPKIITWNVFCNLKLIYKNCITAQQKMVKLLEDSKSKQQAGPRNCSYKKCGDWSINFNRCTNIKWWSSSLFISLMIEILIVG